MSNLKKAKNFYLNFLKQQKIKGEPFYDKIGQLNKFYLPICENIFKDHVKSKKIRVIGLSGGQGSGKSTITQIIKIILEKLHGLRVVFFSMDDFYKTLNERKKMSKKLHKLFLTRGVPGTHDVKLLYLVLNSLKKKYFKPVLIPRFDKSTDDREPRSKWTLVKKRPDIIIFEGWCVGARHQSKQGLIKPINTLEKKYDKKLVWRNKVNNELKKNYSKIFKKINHLIFLKVPNFKSVYKWRLLQETKLSLTKKNKKTMNSTQIKKFIMHYERITKQMIKDLNKKANTVLCLDTKHRLTKIKFN
jgi:D-glycerate 3-kinase